MSKRILWRAAVLAGLTVLATSAPYPGPPLASISAAPTQPITSKATGLWGASTTWSCNCVPTSTSVLTVLAGHTVTVSGSGAAAKVTVEGTLKASRTANSTLTLSGNLIVAEQGVLDYGTTSSPLPSNVTATISWILDEAKYVGGMTTVPVASDIGLWVVDEAKVFTNGPDRGAWTLLTASALKGATQITVDPRFAVGWKVGDEIVIGPSNAPPNGNVTLNTMQDERRKIVSVLSASTFKLDAALTFDHAVQTVTWTDTFDDTYTERLAPPVANLTRNVVFKASNTAHRPHAMIMDKAQVEISDAAFVAFGPHPKSIGKFSNGQHKPFGRYALHFHLQKDSSRNSRLNSIVIYGGGGRGLNVHDSYGVTAYDVVVYDQAHATFFGGNEAFWLEEAVHQTSGEGLQKTGANDLWLDRPLALRFGGFGAYRGTGLHFGAGMGAQILGGHAAGSVGGLGAGMFWPGSTPCKGEAACQEDPNMGVRGFRLTAHSSTFAFAWWNNASVNDDVIDLLGWNSRQGIDFGAYVTATELFQVRLIGNTNVQDAHHASGYKATGFLLDSQNKGGIGIRVRNHIATYPFDDLYENGVIRGSDTAIAHECQPGTGNCGSEPHLQLARVRFEGNPLLLFAWPGQAGARWRIRGQQGLQRPPNFTLYRKGLSIPGGIYDAVYDAVRVDNDTAETVAAPPMVILQQGGGCVSDEAVVPTGTITLCAETNAPTVQFFNGKTLIAQVPASGTAQVSYNMSNLSKHRAYFYAKAIGANGRINYSRVLRVHRTVQTASLEVQPPESEVPRAGQVSAPARAQAPPPAPATAAPAPSPATVPSPPKPTASPSPPPASATPAPSARNLGPAPSRGVVASRLYIVQVGLLPSRALAVKLSNALTRAGFDPYLVTQGGRVAVRLGAFRQRESAVRLAERATAKGFAAVVIDSP